ncbi:uroporphyrinogen-III synthase [compost metagenome]
MKIRSIFLSSESGSSLPLVDFCAEQQIRLLRKSFISFGRMEFDDPGNWDVVFFSSPRAFDFFVSESFDLKAGRKIACIGLETKKHIESAGFSVSFFGENAGRPEEIASEFKEWLGQRIALFPQSTKSNKSIERALPVSQRIPLVIYQTIPNPVLLAEQFSIYLFTSPSNFTSFTTLNSIPEGAKVLAWGTSTAQIILNQSVKVDFILETSTYSELLEILQNLR